MRAWHELERVARRLQHRREQVARLDAEINEMLESLDVRERREIEAILEGVYADAR